MNKRAFWLTQKQVNKILSYIKLTEDLISAGSVKIKINELDQMKQEHAELKMILRFPT